jgi:O-acetylhomoserine/O-acetylserine sulfhydrylase-like pyridoxal-dependent enzyme
MAAVHAGLAVYCLILQGLETQALRMDRHVENALKVAHIAK